MNDITDQFKKRSVTDPRVCVHKVRYLETDKVITAEILGMECINCTDMEGYHGCYQAQGFDLNDAGYIKGKLGDGKMPWED